MEINEYRDGKRHDFWVPLKEVKTGKIHLAITVVDVAADAQSSDESGHNSTTFEVCTCFCFINRFTPRSAPRLRVTIIIEDFHVRYFKLPSL